MFNRSQIMTEAHRIAAECRANALYTDWTRGQVMAMALRAAWLNAKRDAHYSRPSPVLSERSESTRLNSSHSGESRMPSSA